MDNQWKIEKNTIKNRLFSSNVDWIGFPNRSIDFRNLDIDCRILNRFDH